MPPPTLGSKPNLPCEVTHVVLSDDEKHSGITSPETIQQSLHQIHTTGFLVLENAVPVDLIDEIHTRMLSDYEALRNWPGRTFNQGTAMTNISQTPPLVDELFYEEIYANRHMISILENIIGPRPQLGMLTSNLSLPSDETARQAVHSDAYADFLAFPYAMEVFIYLDDVSDANGSTEIWPGTHIYSEDQLIDTGRGWVKKTALNHRAKVQPPFQPTIPKGSICVRDLRLWHAGMPNPSKNIRIMLAMIYFPAWYGCQMEVVLPASLQEVVQEWKADFETKTRWVEGEVEYLRNEGKMNAQVPVNFCQDEDMDLVAVRERFDARDGRELNMMIPVTEANFWTPPRAKGKGKAVKGGAKAPKKGAATAAKVTKTKAASKSKAKK